jgi:tRNA(fMet)-specific endonuclease VapC
MSGNSQLALDTNAYSDWQRGLRWERAIDNAQLVWMPFAMIAELRAGFEAGSRARENALILDAFLTSNNVRELYPDATTLTVYAKLFAELRRRNTPIPGNDLWIAALCVQHNLPLATSDAHFAGIPMLSLVETGTSG